MRVLQPESRGSGRCIQELDEGVLQGRVDEMCRCLSLVKQGCFYEGDPEAEAVCEVQNVFLCVFV